MSSELAEATRDRLRAWFAGRGDVEVAALFGSAARGRMHPGSDIDLYIRLRRGRTWTWSEQREVVGSLEAVAGAEVDLIVEDADRTSVILRLEVARHGVLLFEGSPGAWVTLRAEAMVAYAELEPTLRRCAEGVRRAIQGRSGGAVGS